MGLQGTLDTFELPDVLRLLAATGKTGRLDVEGDRGRGIVSLCQGGLTDATVDADQAGDWPLVDVVFELLRFEGGSFRFTPSLHPDVVEPAVEDLEVVLGRATALLLEWRELAEVVPSPNHRVALAPNLREDAVTLGARRWKLLATIADQPSVAEVAERLSLGEIDVARALCDLVELGVATIRPPAAQHVPHLPSAPSTVAAAATPSAPSRSAPQPQPAPAPAIMPDPLRAGEQPVPAALARSSGGNDATRPATESGHQPHQPHEAREPHEARHGAA